MIELMRDGDYVQFLLEVTKQSDYALDFKVYEVISWEMDNTPYEKELYLEGVIKWDGCSHVWFGEQDENGNTDGYLHLCGKKYWDLHSEVMGRIYDYAKQNIPHYDKEIAE